MGTLSNYLGMFVARDLVRLMGVGFSHMAIWWGAVVRSNLHTIFYIPTQPSK